jgi:hypothetical protein
MLPRITGSWNEELAGFSSNYTTIDGDFLILWAAVNIIDKKRYYAVFSLDVQFVKFAIASVLLSGSSSIHAGETNQAISQNETVLEGP